MRSSRGAMDLSVVVSLLLLLYPVTVLLRPPPHNYVAPLLYSSHLSCAHRTSTVTATLLYSPHLYHHRTTTLHRTPALKCRLCSTTTVHGVLLLCTVCFYCTRHVSTL